MVIVSSSSNNNYTLPHQYMQNGNSRGGRRRFRRDDVVNRNVERANKNREVMRTRIMKYVLRSMAKMMSISETDTDDMMLILMPKTANATAFTWISNVKMLSTIRQNDIHKEQSLKEQILIGGLSFFDGSYHALNTKIIVDPTKINGQRSIECRQDGMDSASLSLFSNLKYDNTKGNENSNERESSNENDYDDLML